MLRSCRNTGPTSTCSSSRTVPPTGPPSSHAPPVSRSRSFRSTSASAVRCGPGSPTQCATVTSVPCSSTPTGSTTPHEVQVLLAQLEAGADMVIGSRFGEGRRRRRRAHAARGDALAGTSHPSLAGERFTDTSSGFLVFNPPPRCSSLVPTRPSTSRRSNRQTPPSSRGSTWSRRRRHARSRPRVRRAPVVSSSSITTPGRRRRQQRGTSATSVRAGWRRYERSWRTRSCCSARSRPARLGLALVRSRRLLAKCAMLWSTVGIGAGGAPVLPGRLEGLMGCTHYPPAVFLLVAGGVPPGARRSTWVELSRPSSRAPVRWRPRWRCCESGLHCAPAATASPAAWTAPR